MRFKFAGDRDAVRLVAKVNHGEEDHQLKLAEIAPVRH